MNKKPNTSPKNLYQILERLSPEEKAALNSIKFARMAAAGAKQAQEGATSPSQEAITRLGAGSPQD